MKLIGMLDSPYVRRTAISLQLLGLPIGPCRSPVAPLSAEKLQKMRASLEAGGLTVKG